MGANGTWSTRNIIPLGWITKRRARFSYNPVKWECSRFIHFWIWFWRVNKICAKRDPDAQILVIGDFWDKEQKDEMKHKACEETWVEFISLDEIKGLEEYQCGMDTTVYDSDGSPHTVEHAGVADHPGNQGMKWIADKIIEVTKE